MSKLIEGFQLWVSGITGNGKSYFLKKVLIPFLVKFKPVIVFDTQEEYAGRLARDNDPSWINLQGHQGFFDEVERNGLKKKVYIVQAENHLDYLRILGLFADKRTRRMASIIIDEAHFVLKNSKFKGSAEWVEVLTRTGRKLGVDIIISTQRPYDTPPDIRNQLRGAISFFQNSQMDIDIYKREKGWQEAEKVRELEKTEYMLLGEIPEQILKEVSKKAVN